MDRGAEGARARARESRVVLSAFTDDRPQAMVVSHERSGTHFLMNGLANCFGYVSRPWLDFDPSRFPINFHHAPSVLDALSNLADQRVANVVKSHHQVDFFAQELPAITERMVIFNVLREPVQVMRSFWRLIYNLPWNEGPRTGDLMAFMDAQPEGQMMRYQMRQYASVLHRWAAHCEGWLAAAEDNPRVVTVRYEALDSNYEATMRTLEAVLGHAPQGFDRPRRDENVIPGGPEVPASARPMPDPEALRAHIQDRLGRTLAGLGY